MREVELIVLDFIQQYLRTPIGDVVMTVITKLGNGGFCWIATGISLLMSKKYRKVGIFVLASLCIEILLCNVILKNVVGRIRPCDVSNTIQLLIPRPKDYSFPSGHTAASFAAVTALYLGKVKRWYLALLLAVAIAFSRLYLYVHYPTDILGGIIVGVISAVIAKYYIEKINKRKK